MENLQREIGKKIKIYRKKKLLTVADLSEAICKSKATVSKYENGQISMDILTLYDIARVLGVHVEQLLHTVEDKTLNLTETRLPAFFRNTKSSIFIITTVVVMKSASALWTFCPKRGPIRIKSCYTSTLTPMTSIRTVKTRIGER